MNQTIRLCAGALALSAGLAAAPGARAQEAAGDNALRRGASSIAVSIDADPTVGFWTMPSGGTALGLVASVQGLRNSLGDIESSQTLLMLSPQVKRYRSTDGAILPYLHGSVFAGLSDFENSGPGGDSGGRFTTVGASAGLGLDWFPVRRVALGGHAGLQVSRSRTESDSAGQAQFDTTRWVLETFTAAIQVQLFL